MENMKNETSIIDGKVLATFKKKVNESISSALIIAHDQSKEVELTVKLNIGCQIKTTREADEDVRRAYNGPEIEYQITRKVKETKYDSKGEITDAELQFDEYGNPILKSTDNQMNMDDYVYTQEAKDNDEDIIDIEPSEIQEPLQITYDGEVETEIPEGNNKILPFKTEPSIEDDFFSDNGTINEELIEDEDEDSDNVEEE